jgi:hypothetical protein
MSKRMVATQFFFIIVLQIMPKLLSLMFLCCEQGRGEVGMISGTMIQCTSLQNLFLQLLLKKGPMVLPWRMDWATELAISLELQPLTAVSLIGLWCRFLVVACHAPPD